MPISNAQAMAIITANASQVVLQRETIDIYTIHADGTRHYSNTYYKYSLEVQDNDGGPNPGEIMAGTFLLGLNTSEVPPVAAAILIGGTLYALGVATYNLLNPHLEGTHTTYEHPSQSPLNNRPRGFDPREPNGFMNNWARGALIGLGAYRIYKSYSDKTSGTYYTPPANDNTYVKPVVIPNPNRP